MIKVLIVDDHALVCLGIRRILENVPDIKILGEAATGEEAIRVAKETLPDIVLLDLKMPGMGGLVATKRLLRIDPQIKVIVMTAFASEPFPSRLLQAGASGYLTKKCGMEEMVQAIRKVYAGEKYIVPDVAQELALKSVSDNAQDASPFEQLSERELQVMIMITSGLRVQDISEKLCLSTKTINSYRYRLFEKFKIKNDVELTHIAIRYDLLDKAMLGREEEETEEE